MLLELMGILYGIPSKFRVFQIASYQLNHGSKDPPTHGGVYFEHLEQFGISFKTFKNITRNVPREIPCFPDYVLLASICVQRSSDTWRDIF